jgi:hypothetical protein
VNQSENNPVKELGHLTLTGYYAGMPICGADSKTDNDAHAVYAPLALPEYRATRCPACLKAYVDTFDPEELNTAPEWVRELRKTAQPV